MKKARLLLLLLPVIGVAFYLRSLVSWRPKKVFSAPGQIWQLAFSSDGETLLIGHGIFGPSPAVITGQFPPPEPATVTVALDIQKGFRPLWEHKDTRLFDDLQFFAHNSRILKSGTNIQLLDAQTGKTRRDYGRLAGPVTISPNGKWLAYKRLNIVHWWQQDGRIYINPASAAQQGKNMVAEQVIGKKSDTVEAFGFSPDGKTFAVDVGNQSGSAARLDFYSTATWKRTHSYADSECKFSDNSFLMPPAIQWSRDGRFLLPSRTYPEGLRVWRIGDGKKLASSSLRCPPPLPAYLELEDKERVLAYGYAGNAYDDEGKVLLGTPLNLRTDFKTLLDLRHEKITAAILSPDGSYLIAGTASGNVFYQRVK